MPTKSSLSRLFSRSVATMLLHACAFAAAQSVVQVPTPAPSVVVAPLPASNLGYSADTSKWPGKFSITVGRKLKIVTIAAPNRKRSCTVASFDEVQIACTQSLGRKPHVYRQEEVASIYIPGQYTQSHGMLIVASVGAAIITGAVFLGVKVPPYGVLGAIPLGLLGSGLILGSGFADDSVQTAPMRVLYLKPGQQPPYPLY